MAKKKSITETGPVGLKGIRNSDLYNKISAGAAAGDENMQIMLRGLTAGPARPYYNGQDNLAYITPQVDTSPEASEWKTLGESSYDPQFMFGSDPSFIAENRAQEQSGFVQAFNGIAKGVTTAATTFIDGTAGLIWGLGQGIYNAATGSKDGLLEGFFNNDISNSMRALNQYMEEVLPNYRTKDEIENPWALRNVSSVNTIADDFLKNLGFTVGAFYSGGAYLGALKGLGTLVRACKMSETAARTIGSIMNGLSEGRIEAGNLYDEQIKTEMGNLQAAYNEEMAKIDAMPDTLMPLEGGGFYSPKQQAKLELAERFKEAQADIEDRASNAAVADMIGNTLYLGASEFWTFGKLYGSKFAKRAELANRTKTTGKKGLDLLAEDAARAKGAAGRIQRNATGYEAMKRPTKKAVLSGLGVGALEGAEEMNQSLMSSTFGNMYTPDSPDAYYKALTEDEYNIRSKDFMTALKNGFAESWGNSDTYKEGAIGFLTGILGMPTFGRAQNSSNETYLGKGKTVGISGGILGKIAENRALNNQAEQEVSTLNKFRRKVKDTEDFFTRMTAFQDAMDGYSTEKNQFEYQNASDNDMFNGIDAFARTGRLGDLKELVTEDFENLSDERLSDIAHNTESDSNEWRNEDGTYMSDTEDGRQKMRQELSKRRDSILESIDEYEQSLADVRYIAGNALDDDQTRELAWLDWKGKQFTKRFNDVRQDVTSFATRLVDTINAFKRGRGRGMLDENTEEGRNIATQIETFGTLLNFLREENITPLALGHFLNSNKEVADLLEDDIWETILEDLSGMDSKTYKDNVTRLKDLAKIGQAAVQFNDRFKEFTSNPSALIGNRQKIEETTARTNEARNNANTLSNVNASTIQQLAQGIQEGQVVPDEIRAILDNDGTPSDVADGITQKLDEAERIVNEVSRIEKALQAAAADPNIDQQAVTDAQAMLEKAAQVVENAEQLLDMSSETYNNADTILSEDEVAAAMSAAQSAEEAESALQELAESRIAGAQTVLTNIERQLRDADERAAGLPTSEGARSEEQPREQQSTGHDSVTTTPPVNRGQQQEPEQQAQPTAYEQEAAAALEESGIPIQPSDRPKAIKDLANLFFTIDNLVRGNQDVRIIASALKALPQYQDLAHIIGLDNLNEILNNKVRKSRIAAGQEKVPQQRSNENRQAPVDPDRLITPEVSDTRVENQIAQEASRPLASIPSGPINYWKTTLPRLSPYASRGDRRTFIDWAKASNRFTPQQIKRMEAIYNFLVSRSAFDNVDNGAVSTKVGSRNKPKVKFVSFQSVNREAGETVIFMIDEQGRILGDLGSLNDASTDRQVGLVNFLRNANQEYQQKIDAGATDDMIELSGETTVLQNMIGKVPYTATTDRRTLNTIWEDKPFTLAVARTSGANSQMIASSRTLSSGQSELEASIMSPLNAVAGQPYVLVETSDPNSGRHFVPVPFNMPPLNAQTAESSLGKVIRSIFDAIPKGDWKAIKMPLMEFLAIQNASVKYSNDGATVQYISVQKQDGTWVKLYDGDANWEGAADKAFRTLLGANIPFQINRKYINGTFMGVSYNRMIGELAETNLPIGGTHTVGDWFTVNPIGQQGSYIQTTGLNPNRNNGQARVVGQEIMYKGVSYTVVPNTWEVFDKDGNKITGDTTHIVARVQCAYNGYDVTKPGPYQTSVGLYNPVDDRFVQQKSNQAQQSQVSNVVKTSNTTQQEQDEQQHSQDSNQTNLLNRVQDSLDTDEKKAIWDLLNDDQKQQVANMSSKKRDQFFDEVEEEIFDDGEFNGDVNEYLPGGSRYSKVDERPKSRVWNEEKERKWLKKALPQLSTSDRLKIHRGLIEISNSKNPGLAYGMFRRGIITISNFAASGTLYHEAFHSVMWTLLSENEREDLFDSAQEVYGLSSALALEESMAEDFRRYVQSEERPLIGKLMKAFRWLKHIWQNLRGKEPVLDKVFYSINRGKYANRKPQDSIVTRFDINSRERESIKQQAIANVGTFDSDNPDIRYRYADDVLALQAEKEFLEKQIDNINEKYNKAIAEIDKRFKNVWFSDGLRRISASSFTSEYSTQQAIDRDFTDIAHILSVSPEDRGHYAIVFSKKEANIKKYNEIKELRQEIDKINKQLKQIQSNAEEAISQDALEDQGAYQDKIEQYYSDKLELGNLTPEQLQYLEQRGITTEEYNRMSQTEREILFKCMV